MDDVGQRRWRRGGQWPEGVAVEVNDAGREREVVAEGGERIGGVESLDIVERHRPSAATISRFVSAQAALSGAISST